MSSAFVVANVVGALCLTAMLIAYWSDLRRLWIGKNGPEPMRGQVTRSGEEEPSEGGLAEGDFMIARIVGKDFEVEPPAAERTAYVRADANGLLRLHIEKVLHGQRSKVKG